MSVNLQLDPQTRKLLVVNGQLVLGDSVAQRLYTRLKMLRNEWFLALDDGTPYLQQGDETGRSILGANVSEAFVRSALVDRILGTEGVTKIISLDIVADHVRRVLNATGVVSTVVGNVQVSL